ncbi:hypothetical protein [Streptomyces sp. NBC_01264]|uniref:hypothetical protein n=1 Tax=Streptomyces sp. NBC_01264 TaxID=2903804 RepID=UPI00224E32F1|nr:hypothetical protein [Streptomyces sp. NBC_01264]MCX4784625.1 hypothetical protein [Streptomyces sp. NBC_01264]
MPKKSAIPATPLYSMMIRTDQDGGLALDIDGQTLAADPDIATLRAKGLAELRIRAALAGRPVRARAVEPTAPTPWLMIVSPDGTVTDVAEHPAAPPSTVAEDMRKEWTGVWAAHVAEHPDPPAASAPPPDRPEAMGTPAPAELPDLLVSVPEYRAMWAAVWAHHAAGDLPAAVTAAYKLESALSGWFGESDAATITVLTARAWLTLCQRTDWRGTTELLITTALRCRAARHRPEYDTVRTARNAHAAWRLLREEDPEAAADLAAPLADMLAILGEDVRRRDVLDWTEAVPATS